MSIRADLEAAFAICAAIIGAGFASGREVVSFFSCFGAASWLGTTAASAGIGLLTYVIMTLCANTRSSSFPALYGALMGTPCQDAVSALHGLLCLITASAMLAAGAELGALTFPLQHSHLYGLLITLFIGLAAVCMGFHSLSLMGMLLFPLIACYFIAMARNGAYPADLSLNTLLPALPMGLIYASFNGALTGGTICLAGKNSASPKRTACLTGLMMLFLLSCANLAMLRAGDSVRQMSMPSVALAANWGVYGYYVSIAILWLAVLSTLCAMLHSLCVQLIDAGLSKSVSPAVASLGAVALSVCGFETLIDTLYPVLGWICSFALVALMLFLPEKSDRNTQK